MTRIELSCIGSIKDGESFGIPHPNKNEIVPYWISNASGASFGKIKVMGVKAESLTEEGGTITVKVMSLPINTHKLISKNGVTANSTMIAELSMSLNEFLDVDYATDWIMSDATIDNEALIYGEFSIVGDIDVQQVYLWVDYENNV